MTPAMFRKLTALGLSQEQMAGVLEVFDEVEAKDEHRRAMQRERWQRWRGKKALTLDKRELTLANDSRAPAGVEDNLLTKSKTGQKKKKEKKDRPPSAMAVVWSELLSVLNDDQANALIEHRMSLRHPLTPRAAALLAKELRACPDPNEAVDVMIANGWRGIKAAWLGNGSRAGPKKITDEAREWMDERYGEDNGSTVDGDVEQFPTGQGEGHKAVVVQLRPTTPRGKH